VSRATALVSRGTRTPAEKGLAARYLRMVRRGGKSPDGELDRCLSTVRQVAGAVRAGAGLDDAWQRASVPSNGGVPRELPGADPSTLAAVRAASHVSIRSGARAADVLDAVATGIEARSQAELQARAVVAGPASSAQVLGWLPLVGPVLGLAVGADPLGALADGGLGTALGVIGVLLALMGRWWSARLVRAATRAGDDDPTVRGHGAGPEPEPVTTLRARRSRLRVGPGVGGTHTVENEVSVDLLLELLAAATTTGASVPDALRTVGAGAGGQRGTAMVGAAVLLEFGADWPEAWSATAGLRVVSDALAPAWRDGVPSAALLRSAARQTRRARSAAAEAAAGRLGVHLLAPLAICHLPAFVLVGLVPVLLDLARSTTTGT
jgi:tight adherence protein B